MLRSRPIPTKTATISFGIGALMLGALLSATLTACSKTDAPVKVQIDPNSAATQTTQTFNAQLAASLNLKDPQSMADATRGLIAKPTGRVKNADGKVVWDYDSFDFLKGEAPATVNPSLWRQAILNNQIGLFKVKDGIYQLRGFDLANMTLIEGKTGWIVVDPLTAKETAQAAMAFVKQHLGDKPVSAMIFTHSHVDHFGGALGVLTAEDAKAKNIPVVAPAGFMEEATSENVLVGTAMSRRSTYMYGSTLPRNVGGLIDNGLGKAVAYGTIGILPPTVLVEKPSEELNLDGKRFVFYNVPGSEAPSEFVFYMPEDKAFGGAELFGHTLHNLYTLRGAKVRDALKWANYMDQAIAYTAEAEVMFNQHNWPVWGRENILGHMEKQRDVYRFLHDQTVRRMNQGQTPNEISEEIAMPKALDQFLNGRGYYGTVRHNVKAVYQFYLGWYDANPANLNPLPPVEASKRYVELAGGIDALVKSAQKSFDAGDYRWAAELVKHAIYSNPDHKAAKELQAKSFEQMAYIAESAPWRNVYLTGARELREGGPSEGLARKSLIDMLRHTPTDRFLEAMAASLNADKAEGQDLKINLHFTDTQDNYVLHVKNSVLHHSKAPKATDAVSTLNLTKGFFLEMMTGEAGAADMLLSDQTKIDGSTIQLGKFFGLLEKATGTFNIVTP
jgi:alkyl sulfatase BDS1-like metallo-beta-lactamase superfamily hydrolase